MSRSRHELLVFAYVILASLAFCGSCVSGEHVMAWIACAFSFCAGIHKGRTRYADIIARLRSQLQLHSQREQLADEELERLRESVLSLRSQLQQERAHARAH